MKDWIRCGRLRLIEETDATYLFDPVSLRVAKLSDLARGLLAAPDAPPEDRWPRS